MPIRFILVLPDNSISRLQRIQNAAAKLVLGCDKYDSSTNAFRSLHWLPVRQRIKFKISVLVFKCLHGQAPAYLSCLLHTQNSRPGLRSSTSANLAPTLTVPFHKNKTFLDRSFAYSGPYIWNSLPPDVRNCENVQTFKKHLKTFLFKQAFC